MRPCSLPIAPTQSWAQNLTSKAKGNGSNGSKYYQRRKRFPDFAISKPPRVKGLDECLPLHMVNRWRRCVKSHARQKSNQNQTRRGEDREQPHRLARGWAFAPNALSGSPQKLPRSAARGARCSLSHPGGSCRASKTWVTRISQSLPVKQAAAADRSEPVDVGVRKGV